jgi:hypothetical protein
LINFRQSFGEGWIEESLSFCVQTLFLILTLLSVAPKGKALRVFFSVTPPGRKAGKGTEMNTHGMLVSHPSLTASISIHRIWS